MIRSERSIRRQQRLARVVARTRSVDASSLRAALEAVKATTSGVKVPNGTTRKIDRIVTEALA